MPHQIMSQDSMMSVRQMPWHGLGVVLDDYPTSINDALEKSGLGWKVRQGAVLVADGDGDPAAALRTAERVARLHEAGEHVGATVLEELLAAVNASTTLTLASHFRANRREDTGDVLGIVSDEYQVVDNREAFEFLDALINSDLYFETAGSLSNCKKVWVLARIPEFIEVGGDQTATFVYCANAHDGSMAVTAAVTPIRIVCANTLGAALRRSETGVDAARTFRFRHTGDLTVKFAEARRVMGMTINYQQQFKILGDRLAQERCSEDQFRRVVEELVPIDEDALGQRAVLNRTDTRARLMTSFLHGGPAGDTRGNSPDTKWCAWNTVVEHADWGRRYTRTTDQVARSFEDTANGLKQRALGLILAA